VIVGTERPVSMLARPTASGVSSVPIPEALMARKVPVPETPPMPFSRSDRGAEGSRLASFTTRCIQPAILQPRQAGHIPPLTDAPRPVIPSR
jgi:hypothetical protein